LNIIEENRVRWRERGKNIGEVSQGKKIVKIPKSKKGPGGFFYPDPPHLSF